MGKRQNVLYILWVQIKRDDFFPVLKLRGKKERIQFSL